jgi:allophanate hydrolase subunit 1
MDAGILCQLIANKIDPTKFQLWGLEIKWLEDPTPEELAIVDDVIKNYKTLEVEYKNEQAKEAEIQAEIGRIKEAENVQYRMQAVANIEAKSEAIKG